MIINRGYSMIFGISVFLSLIMFSYNNCDNYSDAALNAENYDFPKQNDPYIHEQRDEEKIELSIGPTNPIGPITKNDNIEIFGECYVVGFPRSEIEWKVVKKPLNPTEKPVITNADSDQVYSCNDEGEYHLNIASSTLATGRYSIELNLVAYDEDENRRTNDFIAKKSIDLIVQ